MLPLEQFNDFVERNQLFKPSDKILAAVSGGKDSILMVQLLLAAGVSFGIAHCNFNLRGQESDQDESFVKTLANRLAVPFHRVSFDTAAFAKERGVSIQMAARELRYSWFEELRREFDYRYIALAHHRNDAVETVLLNLVRGTGISGLHGIQAKRGNLIRPLMFLTREEIDSIVNSSAIEYREDSSNLSAKYARNKLRLQVIPPLKELNPRLEETFEGNMRRFTELEDLLRVTVEHLWGQYFLQHPDGYYEIDLEGLKALRPLNLLLYELFKPFCFTEPILQDLVRSWDGQAGKMFHSPTHRLLLDRSRLILTVKGKTSEEQVVISGDEGDYFWGNCKIRVKSAHGSNLQLNRNRKFAYLDQDLLQFPLQIRSWRAGDYFFPLGMQGRKKKLSDFFTAVKIPLTEKERVPVVVNGNGDIVWIGGLRLDDRYKISPATKKVIILEIDK